MPPPPVFPRMLTCSPSRWFCVSYYTMAMLGTGQSHAILTDAQEALMSDTQITNAAIEWLNGTASVPLPWFVAVGLHRPHLPFIVPARVLAMYPADGIKLPDRAAPTGMPSAASECSGTWSPTAATHGCHANQSSFELWEQYSYNKTTPGGWGGWQGMQHAARGVWWCVCASRWHAANHQLSHA